MSKIIFVVFTFCRSLITALILLNELDLSDSRRRDDEEKDENFLFFEKLMLSVEEA